MLGLELTAHKGIEDLAQVPIFSNTPPPGRDWRQAKSGNIKLKYPPVGADVSTLDFEGLPKCRKASLSAAEHL